MGRNLRQTVGALLLACLNATLILVALCLWLGWQVLGTAARVSDNAGDVVAAADRVTAALEDLRGEAAALRTALAETATPSGDRATGAAAALRDELGTFETLAARLEAPMAGTGDAMWIARLDRVADIVEAALTLLDGRPGGCDPA